MKWQTVILVFCGVILLMLIVGVIAPKGPINPILAAGLVLFLTYSIFAVPFYYYKETERYKKSHLIKTEKYIKSQLVKCPNCGYEGPGKRFIKGSFGIEVVLWLLFLIPGFIYSIWRLTTPYFGCPKCEYQYVVKVGR